LEMKNGLEKSLVKEEKVAKCLVPAKTMLALPGTRQMIINQAFYQRESSKNPCCPKIAAIWKYIGQEIKMLLAARLTI
jgi:hypothetical protein